MSSSDPRLGPEVIRRLTVDTEPWLSCDDCFRLVDEYVEALLAGRQDPMPAMRVHVRGCPACSEEARTLLVLAAQEARVDPTDALERLAATR
jgi:hypothetical protein